MIAIAAAFFFAAAASFCSEAVAKVQTALEHRDVRGASAALDGSRALCSNEAQFGRFDTLVKALNRDDVATQLLLSHDPPFFLFYAEGQLDSGRTAQLNRVVSANEGELSPPMLFSLARLYAQHREYHRTIELLNRIPAQQADEAVYFNLGLAYSLSLRFDDARRNYFAAIDRRPGYAEAYLRVGLDYAADGQPRFAVPWLYRARELSTNRANVDYALAKQLIQLRFLDSAGEIIASDLQSTGNEPMLLTAEGDLYLARGDYAKAKTRYEQALSAAPGTPPALLGLARDAAIEGKDDEAGKYLRQILASNEHDAAANAELGMLDLNAGNTNSAMMHLEQAWQADPSRSNAGVVIALARIFRQRNQPARALAVLRRVDPEISDSVALHLELARVYGALHRPNEARREQKLVNSMQAQDAGTLRFEDPKTYVQ